MACLPPAAADHLATATSFSGRVHTTETKRDTGQPAGYRIRSQEVPVCVHFVFSLSPPLWPFRPPLPTLRLVCTWVLKCATWPRIGIIGFMCGPTCMPRDMIGAGTVAGNIGSASSGGIAGRSFDLRMGLPAKPTRSLEHYLSRCNVKVAVMVAFLGEKPRGVELVALQ